MAVEKPGAIFSPDPKIAVFGQWSASRARKII